MSKSFPLRVKNIIKEMEKEETAVYNKHEGE